MSENMERAEEVENIADYLSKLMGVHSYAETHGDTLKILTDRAWIRTIARDANEIHETLSRDPRFDNVAVERSGSVVSLYADLNPPIGGISKIELHLSKEQ